MKGLSLSCNVFICVSVCLGPLVLCAAAKDKWISVHSNNFFLVGNASEHDIRQTASKLEQFRQVFSLLFPKLKINSSVPTTVVVFKSDAAYKPFKPLYQGKVTNIGGYFQPGPDGNYITLTSELREGFPYATILHEYVHFLTRDISRYSLVWVEEGLVEYYSTFDVSDGDKQVWLGKAIAPHVLLLREHKLLPLDVLFNVDHSSPYYNEKDKQGVFYAESWALVHYLMLGNQRKRQPQLARYLALLTSGKPVEQSFREAFETDYGTIEKEVKGYIGHNSYPATVFSVDQKLEFEREMQVAPITEAETQFYLGDLLMHLRRMDEAETYLKQALNLDPKLAPAHASLGSLYIDQKHWDEAKLHLEQAVAGDSKNHLAHYLFAELLSRAGVPDGSTRMRFSREMAATMRVELKKAIELQPTFIESYRLLAYVNLVTGEALDDTLGLLKRAQTLAPGREEIDLDVAQIYLRKEDLAGARKTLDPLAKRSRQPHVQSEAQRLLERIDGMLEQQALFEAARREQPLKVEMEEPAEANEEPTAPKLNHGTKTKAGKSSDEPLRLDPFLAGEKASGLFIRIDCLQDGLAFIVKSGDRLLRFHCADPERILLFNARRESLGTVTMGCGPRNPASPVIATFNKSAGSKFDGELLTLALVGD